MNQNQIDVDNLTSAYTALTDTMNYLMELSTKDAMTNIVYNQIELNRSMLDMLCNAYADELTEDEKFELLEHSRYRAIKDMGRYGINEHKADAILQ